MLVISLPYSSIVNRVNNYRVAAGDSAPGNDVLRYGAKKERSMSYIRHFNDIGLRDVALVGGKMPPWGSFIVAFSPEVSRSPKDLPLPRKATDTFLSKTISFNVLTIVCMRWIRGTSINCEQPAARFAGGSNWHLCPPISSRKLRGLITSWMECEAIIIVREEMGFDTISLGADSVLQSLETIHEQENHQ